MLLLERPSCAAAVLLSIEVGDVAAEAPKVLLLLWC